MAVAGSSVLMVGARGVKRATGARRIPSAGSGDSHDVLSERKQRHKQREKSVMADPNTAEPFATQTRWG